MPRFAAMLLEGMRAKGHKVEVWAPEPKFYKLPFPKIFKKWLGYIDQYVIFPEWVKKQVKKLPVDTLFVFTDHAQGPWVPLVSNRPHVIHCHDFLAQRSALGEIPENPTSFTGRLYQKFIRKGYSKGKNFISVSEKTQEDLHRFLKSKVYVSEVVYNGLNRNFYPQNSDEAREAFGKAIAKDLSKGYILHVGGNQWYKHRAGVIQIYDCWRNNFGGEIPLLLIGAEPTEKLRQIREGSAFKRDIHFLSGISDALINSAYAGASVFLFPSLAEGFGWPIAEAMACGCPVITTGEAPMTEVTGEAAFFIKKTVENSAKTRNAANVLNSVIALPLDEREKLIQRGIKNSRRFDSEEALSKIEEIYKVILIRYK
ncbi:glycosyltransferase family 1 protein [Cytophagaceae bacterium ABcell3]|nr:glycosyltransferase family 1 protein [Cytophagaceae bacterium ABcell3]